MHIMLVEDDPICSMVVEAALARSGMAVTSVRTGANAVALLDEGLRPDLLLTDIQLPGDYDGWLVARIYQDECPSMPVIYLTGREPPTDQLNNSVYLRKPVSPILLVEAVKALVRSQFGEPSRTLH